MNENVKQNENKFYSNNQVNVTTSMITFWDSISGAQLKVSILGNGLGIAIWLPFINADGSRKYPTENRYSTVLTQKNAMSLEKIISDIILPAYDRTDNVKCGIFTNSANSNMIEIEVKDGSFFLLMYRQCDPISKIPKDIIRFKFDATNLVGDYDSTTGDMEVITIQSDFFLFTKTIWAYNSLAGGTVAAHGSMIAEAQTNQRIMDYIRAIADAVHAHLPVQSSTPYRNNGGYQSTNNENATIVNNNTNYISPTEVNDLSDLI